MATLEQFQRHLEKFGPECLLEAAATELSESELGQLKAMVDSMQRVYRFKAGKWIERRQGPRRQCEECGLDLSKNARADARFHAHCRSKASSRTYRAKRSREAMEKAPVVAMTAKAAGGVRKAA